MTRPHTPDLILPCLMSLDVGSHCLEIQLDAEYLYEPAEPGNRMQAGWEVDDYTVRTISLVDEDGGEQEFSCISEVPSAPTLCWSDISTETIQDAIEARALECICNHDPREDY
jgi:hypothetical protein